MTLTPHLHVEGLGDAGRDLVEGAVEGVAEHEGGADKGHSEDHGKAGEEEPNFVGKKVLEAELEHGGTVGFRQEKPGPQNLVGPGHFAAIAEVLAELT